MSIAKCFKCGATGEADTFEKAKALLDHAVGLSRSIKCGEGYGAVQEIKPNTPQVITTPQTKPIVTETIKVEPKTIEAIPEINYVEPKTKPTGKKFKDKKS